MLIGAMQLSGQRVIGDVSWQRERATRLRSDIERADVDAPAPSCCQASASQPPGGTGERP